MRSNKLLIIYSSLLTLIFLELLFNFIIFPKNDYNYKNRYLIFSEGKIFKNIDNFFTYEPNKELIASNYYFNNGEFNLVYKHKIYTNNLGLVQKTDIDSELPSILFLGDSFTEGQGAESWINQFNGKYKNYQIINGGFFGQGIGEGVLKDRVPEAHTDYIIAVISEEFGLLFILILMIIFLFFSFHIIKK